MSTLTLQLHSKKNIKRLSHRILIGRWTENAIVIPATGVSRVHACIYYDRDIPCIIDLGSKTGTRVNRKPISSPTLLKEGDTIQIGPATLIYNAVDDDLLEESWHDTIMPNRPTHVGVLLDCPCGCAVWSPAELCESLTRCRACDRVAVVPRPVESNSPCCGVCQWPVSAADSSHICPHCNGIHHTDCWSENNGCSTWGCEGANASTPHTQQQPESSDADLIDLDADAPESQRKLVLIACTSIGLILSVITAAYWWLGATPHGELR